MTTAITPQKKIIICIDGTGNEIGDRETNVLKLYKTLDKNDPDQMTHYIMGIGTYYGPQWFGQLRKMMRGFLGQTFGYGLEDDVLSAYRVICENYVSGDTRYRNRTDRKAKREAFENDQIYITGFSRGAYAARMLAGFIHNFGFVDRSKLHLVAPVFRAYRQVSDSRKNAKDDLVFQSLREYERALRPKSAPIRALLLFDTVSSLIRFRRPVRNLLSTGSIVEFGTHPSVNSNVSVRIVIQALAKHERRTMFRAMRWRPEMDQAEFGEEPGPLEGKPFYHGNNFRDASTKRAQYVVQRWFPGYHSDIGGSPREDESGIGKLTLLWMLDRLKEVEAEADAEDNTHRDTPLPDMPLGLRLKGEGKSNGARARYLEGKVEGAKTPGGLPYIGPNPNGPLHNSFSHSIAARLWAILEFVPKSLTRREDGPPALIRRGWLGFWYFPLFEPRHMPDEDEKDPSLDLH
ncbi:DUF2235 domain-containing protein [Alisedimentitalea sp. MJ-SS2]|uniref:T6SS phospholipase effector Tle1-like catalytic domain-containing protein n=1 Tax=Aliisedimentitalea sp. MJ-SS2 TaxID=3049795 RepID=UPI0029110361|nr:DUF2235 domain-containing protein [Alisedimentitalea sp. MJ-SS2]MDU8926779.1 DUF2235 domain-containing protein [Alisedimentitalea sp. MJ-SS2]